MTTLEHYAEVNPAAGAMNRASQEQVAFVPMAAVSEEGKLGDHETRALAEVEKGYTNFARGDVLMAKITPCMENGKAALVSNLSTKLGFGSTEFHVLRARPGVDARFLFYLVWNQRFREEAAKHMTGSAGQKRVPASYLKQAKVPLVEPKEQRRIADILDKADAIRRKRKEAIALTEDLLRSAFLEMVGPCAKAYDAWPEALFESLAVPEDGSMRTGPFGSDLRHSEFVDEGVAVLGIDNAVQNRFAWGERRFITHKKYERLTRYTVRPHDVIVTIMGTTGRSAVVPADIPLAITTKHLATITLNRDVAEPEFVAQAIHRHPAILAQIQQANRGAIMSGLNLGLIKSLVIRLPPIEMQRAFGAFTKRLRDSIENQEAARSESEDLIDALVARAFSGKLCAPGTGATGTSTKARTA